MARGVIVLEMGKVLVGLVVVAGFLAGSAGATFPGRNGLIAGEIPSGVSRDASYVSLFSSTATTPKFVVRGDHPMWSPDGKSLVMGQAAGIVMFRVQGMRLTGRQVLVRQTATANMTGNRWVGIPSWSGDGQWIVYVRQETPLAGADIYKVRVSDGYTVRLTHAPYGWNKTDPTWSPDGSTIAYTDCNPNGSTCSLDLMDADGTHKRVVYSRPHVEANDPKWSPDGTQLGLTLYPYYNNLNFPTGAAVFDVASHKVMTIYDTERFTTWTPDGRGIVVQRDDDYPLRIMNESGTWSRDVPVTSRYAGFDSADWQPLH